MDFFRPTPSQRQSTIDALADTPWPSGTASEPLALLGRCPAAGVTPLAPCPEIARRARVGQVLIKDERGRMGLGSFKALGAAYVIAHDAQRGAARGQTYVTASAGNHGMSVAAGAAAFGARAVIFLAETVPESFAERLRSHGADVRRHGQIYEQSMQGAAECARQNSWTLLSDSSWPGYHDRPHRLMEGYLVLMHEVAAQMDTPPSHIFLQAGVGGLAAACAVYARKIWGRTPLIVVVEPEVAPALFASVRAGSAQVTQGPASDMGRLDCKEPSVIALKGLARDADVFATISEAEGHHGNEASAAAGFASTPSGAAGIAALLAASRQGADLGLDATSCVLVILSETAA